MEKNEIVLAFEAWKNSVIKECCDNRTTFSSHFDREGKALPDDKVCQRERHWREYCRLRDNEPSIRVTAPAVDKQDMYALSKNP